MAGRKAHGFVILYRGLSDLQVQKPYSFGDAAGEPCTKQRTR